MTANDLQQQLDSTGTAAVPAGTTALDVPLFLGPGQAVVGSARQGCRLDPYNAGQALVVGWRRGLLDDSYFPPFGFRTRGDAHLFSRGTELDLGPCSTGGVLGWPTLTSLRVEYVGVKHGTTWVYQQSNGDFEQVLCGIQAGDVHDQPRPSPWLLWWTNAGVLKLSLRFTDGTFAHIPLSANPERTDLGLDVSVDFGTGQVAGVVNGLVFTDSIPPGKRLAGNTDWPFTVGRADPICNSAYWSAKVGDVTHTLTRVSCGSWVAMVDYASGRPGTYPGGPSLPLLKAWSNCGTRYVMAVHKEQGPSDAAGNTTVRGVTLESGTSNPLVTFGAAQGQVTFQDVGGAGGTRFLQCSGLAVVYPLLIADVFARGQKDRQLWLFHASNVSVRDSDLGYGVRGAASLLYCSAVLDTVFVAPPGLAQDVVIEQVGGVVTYSRLAADYEYTPGAAAVVRVTPSYFDAPDDPTAARLLDCVGGTAPLYVVGPRQAGYTGPCTVEVDRTTVSAS